MTQIEFRVVEHRILAVCCDFGRACRATEKPWKTRGFLECVRAASIRIGNLGTTARHAASFVGGSCHSAAAKVRYFARAKCQTESDNGRIGCEGSRFDIARTGRLKTVLLRQQLASVCSVQRTGRMMFALPWYCSNPASSDG